MKKILQLFIIITCCISYGNAQISLINEIEVKNHAITSIAYCPNNSLYATAGYDQTIVIRNKRGEIVKRIGDHKDIVKAMAFSHNGKYLLAGGDRKTVFVWNIENGALTYTMKGHSKDILELDVNNKGMIITGSSDETIRLWNLTNGTEFKTLDSHEDEITGLAFNGEGTQFASSSLDGTVKIWNAETGGLLKTLKDTDKKAGKLSGIAFSPDGNYIAASNNNKIVLWNALNGLKIKEFEYKSGTVLSMKFSPDNRYIATGTSGEKFVIWDVETGSRTYENTDTKGKIYALEFSPDGERIIIGDFTKTLYVWDIKALGIAEVLASMKSNTDEPEAAQKEKLAIIVPKSSVDNNIPERCKTKYKHRYALIIGNEDYSSHQMGLESEVNVDYAINDAVTFSNYVRKTFCVPEENIMLLKNAKAVEMHRAIEKISLLTEITGAETEIIFYFAGHGFPNEVTKEPYLMPVDVSGNDLRFAINIKELYAKLTENPHNKVTVFLDACFSGGARNQGLLAARGIKVVPKNEGFKGNLIVFSASSGQESSLPYHAEYHGMFTYVLLKKLQETKGDITYEQLGNHLKTHVAKKSILINNKPQNPQVNVSPAVIDLWKEWEF